MKDIVITDHPVEMAKIGAQIISEKPQIYTPALVDQLRRMTLKYMPDASENEREEALFRSVYDYWVYGNTIDEEFFLGFRDKKHDEKLSYITSHTRFYYVDHLNPKEHRHLLDSKYELYQKIKASFKREMIQIASEEDYDEFRRFATQNHIAVVKPLDLACGMGVRKIEFPTEESSLLDLFHSLLLEGQSYKSNEKWGRGRPVMIVEQLIHQNPMMGKMHEASVNVVRISTIRLGESVYIFYPWVKFGTGGSFVAAAATDGCCACIDPYLGVINTNGYDESCNVFELHPDSGIRFEGFEIPEWKALVEMTTELAKQIDNLCYIGWDMAYSDEGWCVVEANTQATFDWQMIIHRGVKEELEQLLKWKPEKQFWWE